jgi:hypothetical protein
MGFSKSAQLMPSLNQNDDDTLSQVRKETAKDRFLRNFNG